MFCEGRRLHGSSTACIRQHMSQSNNISMNKMTDLRVESNKYLKLKLENWDFNHHQDRNI